MVVRKKTKVKTKTKTRATTRTRATTTGDVPSVRINEEHLVDNVLIQTGTEENDQQQTAVDAVDEPAKSMESNETAIEDNGMNANTTIDTSAMESKNHLTSIILDPVITITEAGSLYKSLQSNIDSEGDVNIDASKVQMIDMAGLQLLLVFALELEKFQRKVHWQNPSSVFRQAAELMDFSRRLRL